MDMADRFKQRADLKDRINALENELEALKNEAKILDNELAEYMVSKSLKNPVVGGYRFQLYPQMYASVPAGNVDIMRPILEAHGGDYLIKETINANSLKAWIRGLEDKGELPESLQLAIKQEVIHVSRKIECRLVKA